MKKLLLVITLFFIITSCGLSPQKKNYTVVIKYTNGESETLCVNEVYEPRLNDSGCVYINRNYICGVQKVIVLSENHSK